MLSRTVALLRVSPFSIFMKDLKKKGELRGIPLSDGTRVASRMYRNLTPAQMRSLQERAQKMTYPALAAFNEFQRREARALTHLSNAERQRVIGERWRKSEKRLQLQIKKMKEKKKEQQEARRARMEDKKRERIFPTVRRYRIHKVDPSEMKRPGFPEVTTSKKSRSGSKIVRNTQDRIPQRSKNASKSRSIAAGKAVIGPQRVSRAGKAANVGGGAKKNTVANVAKAMKGAKVANVVRAAKQLAGKARGPSSALATAASDRGRSIRPAAAEAARDVPRGKKGAPVGVRPVPKKAGSPKLPQGTVAGGNVKQRLAVAKGVKNLMRNREGAKKSHVRK